jgi:hypothetical protein
VFSGPSDSVPSLLVRLNRADGQTLLFASFMVAAVLALFALALTGMAGDIATALTNAVDR